MKKNIGKIIYEVLQARPFSKECIKEKDIYSAYCLRVAETVDMKLNEE